MSLPWVKLHVPLLNNRDFRRLSPGAKLTFVTCLMLAGDLDKGDYSGRLESESGPVSLAELAEHTGMRSKLQAEAITDLLKIRFLSQDMLGALIVERFEEKAAPLSALSTDRVKRSRERKKPVPVTFQERFGNTAEVEAEAEVDNCASLRSAAIGYATFPEDRDMLAGLALIFVQRFAHCANLEKAEAHLEEYLGVLTIMRERGLTIAQAWKACEDALAAAQKAKQKPLFFARIRKALSFLPGSTAQKYRNGKSSSSIPTISAKDLA